jgi:DNA-binding transcriptional ArsR family regulator
MIAGMDTLTAVADPVRRHVIEILAQGERSAGEIGELFPIAQPSMSRHLRVLRSAGIVNVRAEATRRIYSLNPRPLEEIESWAARHLEMWHDRFDKLGRRLDVMAAKEEKQRKKERKA